jgi:hypothetical protein
MQKRPLAETKQASKRSMANTPDNMSVSLAPHAW